MRVMSVGRVARLAALTAASALVIACSGAEESKSPEPAKSGAASSGAASGPLVVTVGEWSVKPSVASTKAGKASMKVTNSGATPHELMIVKTDAAQDKLDKANGHVDEAKYPPLARTKQLNGGQSEDLTVDLAPGKYVLVCNISGHYDLGMRSAFTVN